MEVAHRQQSCQGNVELPKTRFGQRGEDPLQVAAEQLTRDILDVLHTIGGNTNTTAADLALIWQKMTIR